jgi:hypothetical protein
MNYFGRLTQDQTRTFIKPTSAKPLPVERIDELLSDPFSIFEINPSENPFEVIERETLHALRRELAADKVTFLEALRAAKEFLLNYSDLLTNNADEDRTPKKGRGRPPALKPAFEGSAAEDPNASSPGRVHEPLPAGTVVLPEDSILEFEKKACTEFFTGSTSKTPSRYLKIRNHIIKQWRSSPQTYLNAHHARRGLTDCGDVNAIGRVHKFLEKINAINVNVERPAHWRGRPAAVDKTAGLDLLYGTNSATLAAAAAVMISEFDKTEDEHRLPDAIASDNEPSEILPSTLSRMFYYYDVFASIAK